MAIDYESLFRRHRVDFATSGPNVGHDEIAVRCPRCGSADPSHHMGISLSGRGWFCLKCKYGGKSPVPLIKMLLRCTEEEARRLAGHDDAPAVSSDDELSRVLDSLRDADAGPRPPAGPLTLPPEFHPLLDGRRASAPFLRYVRSRGYDGADLEWVAREYDLRYATTGSFAWRVIFPVRDRRGALVTWQGRTIRPPEDVPDKYRALSTRPEKAAYGRTARVATSSALLGMNALWAAPEPRALVVCEGAMDALRLSLYGRALGVRATCMFGLNVSDAQLEELEMLRERFPRVRLCVDAGEELRVMGLLAKMQSVGARLLRLQDGAKDPGELSPEQAADLCLRALED